MLFAMNFKRKWKRLFQAKISLKMSAKIELAKHIHVHTSQTSSYRIGFIGHLFFKCDEMSVSWAFHRFNTSHSPEKDL